MFLLPLQHAYVTFLSILLLSNRLVDAQECSATVAELTAGAFNRVTVPCIAKELVLTDSQRNGTHLNIADCAVNSTMQLGLNKTNNAGNLKLTFLCDELEENKCYTFTVSSAPPNSSVTRDSVKCQSSTAPGRNQAASNSSRAVGLGSSSTSGAPTAQSGSSQTPGGNHPSSTMTANSGSTMLTVPSAATAVNPTTAAADLATAIGSPATTAGNPTTTPSSMASTTAPGGTTMTTPMSNPVSAATGGTSSNPTAMEATNNTQSADSCSQSLQQCLAREASATHRLVKFKGGTLASRVKCCPDKYCRSFDGFPTRKRSR